MSLTTLLFSSRGRLAKKPFWIASLSLTVVQTVLGIIPLVGLITVLLGVWIQLNLSSKRLHDSGRRGRLAVWAFVFELAAIAALIGIPFAMYGEAAFDSDMVMAVAGFGFAATVLGYWAFMIWVGTRKSDPGPNAYGPPPATAQAPVHSPA